MYGEDKTTLDELTKTITELEGLKIDIIEKTEKTSELNNAVEKMENQIKQADDKILNDTHFVATGNETATENEQNTTDGQSTNTENTTATQNEISISKDSNVNILIDNINTLVNKVNEQVKAETERKAEEERKKQEENIINGDLSSFAGTYKDSNNATLTLDKNGKINGGNSSGLKGTEKPKSITKQNDGTYKLTYSVYWSAPAWLSVGWHNVSFYIVPNGISYRNTNTNSIRIVDTFVDGGDYEIYYKK